MNLPEEKLGKNCAVCLIREEIYGRGRPRPLAQRRAVLHKVLQLRLRAARPVRPAEAAAIAAATRRGGGGGGARAAGGRRPLQRLLEPKLWRRWWQG